MIALTGIVGFILVWGAIVIRLTNGHWEKTYYLLGLVGSFSFLLHSLATFSAFWTLAWLLLVLWDAYWLYDVATSKVKEI